MERERSKAPLEQRKNIIDRQILEIDRLIQWAETIN